jgi:catechol 2,3-dioxygenase-like lactoylglutathione lyase family enzyme
MLDTARSPDPPRSGGQAGGQAAGSALGTPGGGDSLALHLATTDQERARVGHQGGYEHFGIHLPDRSGEAIDAAVRRVEDAGGHLLDRGEHAPGVPYAYVKDADGYTIEI